MLTPDLSPATSLALAARQHPQRTSLISEDGIWSVEESFNTVGRLAAFLEAQGIQAGDGVAVISANSVWHFFTHVACAWLQAITIPISAGLAAPEMTAVLTQARPRMIFYGDSVAQITLEIARDIDAHVCAIDDLPAQVSLYDPIDRVPPRCADETAAIVFTSGSSGKPRGVPLTHANLWWGTMGFRDGFEYTPGVDVVGVCAPMSHVGGFNGTTMDTFDHGGTVVVMPAFQPGHVLDLIERHHIAVMFVVPTMARALCEEQNARPRDLRSWRLPLVGGDTMDPALDQRMRTLGLNPVHVWGMTELAAAGAWLSADQGPHHCGAIGMAFPFVDVRIVDEDGHMITTAATPGVVQVQGPNVADHYLDGQKLCDNSGFFSTGDVGQYDKYGYLFFMGRASRLINTGGEMVSPAFVESQIRSLANIRDVLVVDIPDKYWGQIVGAIIVGEKRCDKDLHQQLHSLLATWQLPRRIAWVDHLPLTTVGKPDINKARDLLHTNIA